MLRHIIRPARMAVGLGGVWHALGARPDASFDHGVFELHIDIGFIFVTRNANKSFVSVRFGPADSRRFRHPSCRSYYQEVHDSVRIVHHALARVGRLPKPYDDAFTKVRRADRYAYARRMPLDWRVACAVVGSPMAMQSG